MKIIEAIDRNPTLTGQLLEAWESPVKATHLFLSEEEIENIKNYVPQTMQEIPYLIIMVNEHQVPVGFMGTTEQRPEMLFISDVGRGKGSDRELLIFEIEKCSMNDLAVNKQNPLARGFYKYMGFRMCRRTRCDEQGNPYPLLYMKLNQSVRLHKRICQNIYMVWKGCMYRSGPPDQRHSSFLYVTEKAIEEDCVQSGFCRYHWSSEFSETNL